MGEAVVSIVGVVGLAAGAGLVWLYMRTAKEAERQRLQETVQAREHELDVAREELLAVRREKEEVFEKFRSESARSSAAEEKNSRIPQLEELLVGREKQNGELQAENSRLMAKISELETRLVEEGKRTVEKLAILDGAKEQLKNEFQAVANKIFEDKSQRFTDQNKTNLDTMLSPVREQLKDFKKRIEDVYDKESKDRLSLFHEINHLKKINQTISKEAENLTNALKGQTKTQGIWGEVVLERILEESGLHRGREYETQASFTNEEGRQKRPDVVVHLPEGKDVVIDAKVSLTAYERYCSAESEEERQEALKQHVLSVRSHIKGLSGQKYDDLEAVRSLDFVLMFLPVEGAFLAAMESDSHLFSDAFEKNIMVVCPSTLLATLRTIQNIWRNEDQSRNALIIAKKAGDLYDKFVGFVESLDDIGDKIGKAQKAYDRARSQLSTGKGHLVRRAEELKALGVKAKKQLPESLVEQALDG